VEPAEGGAERSVIGSNGCSARAVNARRTASRMWLRRNIHAAPIVPASRNAPTSAPAAAKPAARAFDLPSPPCEGEGEGEGERGDGEGEGEGGEGVGEGGGEVDAATVSETEAVAMAEEAAAPAVVVVAKLAAELARDVVPATPAAAHAALARRRSTRRGIFILRMQDGETEWRKQEVTADVRSLRGVRVVQFSPPNPRTISPYALLLSNMHLHAEDIPRRDRVARTVRAALEVAIKQFKCEALFTFGTDLPLDLQPCVATAAAALGVRHVLEGIVRTVVNERTGDSPQEYAAVAAFVAQHFVPVCGVVPHDPVRAHDVCMRPDHGAPAPTADMEQPRMTQEQMLRRLVANIEGTMRMRQTLATEPPGSAVHLDWTNAMSAASVVDDYAPPPPVPEVMLLPAGDVRNIPDVDMFADVRSMFE